ncbi:MAG: hypothetical protein FWF03_02390 [Defluviitaleaceae bacterium]|nr:hypothetical protein [Defluviitaleaceae bacterium]
MVTKQKIITMAKLAVYDKRDGGPDRVIDGYYRHDYIYKKNMATRFCAGAGAAVLAGVYWVRTLLFEGADIFELDLQARLTETLLFIIAAMAVYSVIGTLQCTRQYYLVQKRLKRYSALTHQLERINLRAAQRAEAERSAEAEGAAGSDYEPVTDRTRIRR